MALLIAAVNATLLAIFIAAYVAFDLLGREDRVRLEVDVLNAANRMRDENEHWQLRMERRDPGYSYKASEVTDVRALVATLGRLGEGSEARGLPSADDEVHRGRILVDLFFPISHLWPLGMIEFVDAGVAKTWAEYAHTIASSIQLSIGVFAPRLRSLAEAADDEPTAIEDANPFYELPPGTPAGRIFVPHHAVSQLEGFAVYINRVVESATETRRASRTLDIHDGLYHRDNRRAAVMFGAVVVVFGVVLPLVWDGVPRWVSAGIPVAVYALAAYGALNLPIPAAVPRLWREFTRTREQKPPVEPVGVAALVKWWTEVFTRTGNRDERTGESQVSAAPEPEALSGE